MLFNIKFIALLYIIFIAKGFAQDVPSIRISPKAQNLQILDLSLLTSLDNKLTEALNSNSDSSPLLKVIPPKLNESEKTQLLNDVISFKNNLKTKMENFNLEEFINNLYSKLPEAVKQKLEQLKNDLMERYNKISENAKNFFTNYFNQLKETIEKIKKGEAITEDDITDGNYKLIQEYLNLSEDDRNSIGSAFPTLSNFVNNEEFLKLLREITEESTIEDYNNIGKQIFEKIKDGSFNPTQEEETAE
uniref:DUF148 domain-containing protein n=1 Tax=Parastrongyloides trichosuri TaxID=131310 RepID=A0A0N4ZDD0_PARTI